MGDSNSGFVPRFLAQIMRKKKTMFAVFVTIGLIPIAGLAIMNATTKPPVGLGVKDGRLAPCPDKPNCVCSQDGTYEHWIEPFRFVGPADEAWQRLLAVIENDDRANIKLNTGEYLHVEFTTRLLRFVDDTEFAMDNDGNCIHVRSCSRIGYSDLGVNRKRVESIRAAFENSEP